MEAAALNGIATPMLNAESIRASIAAGLCCDVVEVAGDGRHFEALVVSSAFGGLTRIARHRLVYQALGERMREEIHALSIRTLTPEERRAEQER